MAGDPAWEVHERERTGEPLSMPSVVQPGRKKATAARSGQRPPQPREPPANAFAMPASRRQY